MPITRKKSITSAAMEDIVKLHGEGKTAQEISDLSSLSHAIVMQILHDAQQALSASKPERKPSSMALRTRASVQQVSEEDEQKLVDFLVELDQFNLNWSLLRLRQILREYAMENSKWDFFFCWMIISEFNSWLQIRLISCHTRNGTIWVKWRFFISSSINQSVSWTNKAIKQAIQSISRSIDESFDRMFSGWRDSFFSFAFFFFAF